MFHSCEEYTIRDVFHETLLSPNLGEAQISTIIEFECRQSILIVISLEVDEFELLPCVKVTLREGFSKIMLPPVRIIRPHLWWPIGLGMQSLYKITMRISQGSGHFVGSEKNIGIRKIRTIPLGKSTEIQINGRKIDLKGKVWQFPERLRDGTELEILRKILTAACNAKINMLRITSEHGTYAEKEFLSTCDSLGIMVWHDFTAGNISAVSGIEPATDSEQKIKHIRNHPSLVIFGREIIPSKAKQAEITENAPSLEDLSAMLSPEVPVIEFSRKMSAGESFHEIA